METTVNVSRKQPKYWALATAAILVTAFVLVQPLQTIKADVVPQVSQGEFNQCVVRVNPDATNIDSSDPAFSSKNAPEDGIAMNTIKKGDIVKTIHAEKQIFDCKIIQGGLNITVDVTIVAEIFENITSRDIERVQAEAITCIKTEFNADLVNCFATIPSGSVVLDDCDEEELKHPLEMNTVNKGNKVKTIKAEKEVFYCDFDRASDGPTYSKKVDLVIFTDIYEDLSELPDDPIVEKQAFSFRCVTIIATADVEACDFSQAGTL
ncbi:MAG: hypothetical protein ACRD38_12885 [Nitrososphaerales archaeon]